MRSLYNPLDIRVFKRSFPSQSFNDPVPHNPADTTFLLPQNRLNLSTHFESTLSSVSSSLPRTYQHPAKCNTRSPSLHICAPSTYALISLGSTNPTRSRTCGCCIIRYVNACCSLCTQLGVFSTTSGSHHKSTNIFIISELRIKKDPALMPPWSCPTINSTFPGSGTYPLSSVC